MRQIEKTKEFDIDLDLKSALPIYEQIKNAVKLAIFKNQLVDGDKIISMRELSTRYNVNQITIMKAYKFLEIEGYLYSPKKWTGYYVRVDKEKLQKEKKDIFKKEVYGFLKKISDMGYKAEDLLAELNEYLNKKKS